MAAKRVAGIRGDPVWCCALD